MVWSLTSMPQVASVHGGEVPLHSRLFAQWLHYAFPHECPYPHMSGKINPLTQSQFSKERGRGSDASELEKQGFIGQDDTDTQDLLMSQWTIDEELYTSSRVVFFDRPSERSSLRGILRVVSLVCGPVALLLGMAFPSKSAKGAV